MSDLPEQKSLLGRLWIYQAERFPIGKTAVLLLVFTMSAINLSAALAGRSFPGPWTYVFAWVVAIIFFFQLRAADEFKDLEDDRRFRPERAIPRGLVSLELIIGLALAAALPAVLLSAAITPAMVVPLVLVWAWLGLMTVEFFVPVWLRARPILYLVSHMAIMAFIDFYVTAGEWLPHSMLPPPGIWLFVILSCVNGCVLEFGRKIWAPQNEREGVETYSRLFGPRRAALLWAGLATAAAVLLGVLGWDAGAGWLAGALGAVALLPVWLAAFGFARNPTPVAQNWVDGVAGLWVFACYAIAGLTPFAGFVI